MKLTPKDKSVQIEDLTGRRFDRLVILKCKGSKAECLCDCGTIKLIWTHELKRGSAKSCGCLMQEWRTKRLRKASELIGQKRHHLKALEILPKRASNGELLIKCLCDCGNYTEIVSSKFGVTKSCGCAIKLFAIKNIINRSKLSWEEKQFIKSLINDKSGYSYSEIGKMFKVSSSSIFRAVHNQVNYEEKVNELIDNLNKKEIKMGKKSQYDESCIGKKINHLTIVKHLNYDIWLTKCDCGSDFYAQISRVVRGDFLSCGCIRKPRNGGTEQGSKFIGRINQFGAECLEIFSAPGRKEKMLRCRCACSKEFTCSYTNFKTRKYCDKSCSLKANRIIKKETIINQLHVAIKELYNSNMGYNIDNLATMFQLSPEKILDIVTEPKAEQLEFA